MPPRSNPMGDLTALIRAAAESGDPAAARAAEALALWMRSRTITLERALGAADGLRASYHQRNRNAALAALARRFAGLSERQAAARVYEVVARYRASAAWPRDRDVGHRPDGDAGLAYDVLANGGLPGVEHIRKSVLGDHGAFDPPQAPVRSAA
jgi:hypothetical protein